MNKEQEFKLVELYLKIKKHSEITKSKERSRSRDYRNLDSNKTVSEE